MAQKVWIMTIRDFVTSYPNTLDPKLSFELRRSDQKTEGHLIHTLDLPCRFPRALRPLF